MNYPHITKDSKGNEIHYKGYNGYGYEYEYWKEYDSNNNMIYYKTSNGYECWKEYDLNNNVIHYKNSKGSEYWYNSDGEAIPNPNIPTELTLDQIAEKFNIPVGSLKIVKN